jgi:hypothetical protein
MNPLTTNPANPPKASLGLGALPVVMMVLGAILAGLGALKSFRLDGGVDFGISWLLAFMFFLSISLGTLFLVLVHHLTDAGWSVGIRRFNEHIAALLFPQLAILFLPVALLAPKIYSWMTIDPATDNTVAAKLPVFTKPGFWIASAILFGIWWLLTSQLKRWSLKQDETGAAECTHKMRFYSGWGIVVFALTLTFAGILWMKSLQHEWYSAMYGVYFFASSAWVALATVYILTVWLKRRRVLAGVFPDSSFYFIGLLFFAFTLFQAYTEFAQYFVVWNANMPSETFWYLIRENGSWWWVSMILIFGHFMIPFFILLPVSMKSNAKVVIPVCLWAWLMHALDLAFNILPAHHPEGFPLRWVWLQLGCFLFMGGFLTWSLAKNFAKHAPYPQRDPRLLEAMGVNLNVANDLAGSNPAEASR